jgi:hypothetical protein
MTAVDGNAIDLKKAQFKVSMNHHSNEKFTCFSLENLFQSSHERKFLGFKLLEKVLPMLALDQVIPCCIFHIIYLHWITTFKISFLLTKVR